MKSIKFMSNIFAFSFFMVFLASDAITVKVRCSQGSSPEKKIRKMYAGFQLPLAVVICSYNNEKWVKRNLDSVFMQNYKNFHVYYVNDCSDDKTAEYVQDYIDEHGLQDRLTFINNEHRCLKLKNMYDLLHDLDDDLIIVELDGDDWYAHDNVLSYINDLYQEHDIWVTYGRNKSYPNGKIGPHKAYAKKVIEDNSFRDQLKNEASQPRSFYAWLFKKVRREDLMYKDNFYPINTDPAYMYPILEMAGKHSMFISDILYIRNRANPINTEKAWPVEFKKSLLDHIKQRKKYKPIVFADFDRAMVGHPIHKQRYEELLKKNSDMADFFVHARKRYQDFIKALGYTFQESKIPKIIHQIWIGSPLPEKYKTWIKTWQDNHPGWIYKLWTDKDVEALNFENKQYYEQAENWGEKADILRYELIYRYGGVYVDIDFVCKKPLDYLHDVCDFYACFHAVPLLKNGRVANGLFAAAPQHPLLEQCVKEIKNNRHYHKLMYRTGPDYFTKIIKNMLFDIDGVNVLLPANFFYPCGQRSGRGVHMKSNAHIFLKQETLGVHYYDSNWMQNSKKKKSGVAISIGY